MWEMKNSESYKAYIAASEQCAKSFAPLVRKEKTVNYTITSKVGKFCGKTYTNYFLNVDGKIIYSCKDREYIENNIEEIMYETTGYQEFDNHIKTMSANAKKGTCHYCGLSVKTHDCF